MRAMAAMRVLARPAVAGDASGFDPGAIDRCLRDKAARQGAALLALGQGA